MVEGQSMTTLADVVAQVHDRRLEDFVRESVVLVAGELMEGEISGEIGAELGEVAPGVQGNSSTRVPIDLGPSFFVTVLTGPAAPQSGTYYVTATITLEVGSGDTVACQLNPQIDGTTQQVGNAPQAQSFTMTLDGAMTLTAGQTPAVLCVDANLDSTTQFGEGNITAVLINSSNGTSVQQSAAKQSSAKSTAPAIHLLTGN